MLEKIILLILGATAGIVVGMILLSFPAVMHLALGDSMNLSFIILTSVIGILITTIALYIKRVKLSNTSDIIRNETIALITHEMRTALTSTSWAIQYILESYHVEIRDADKKMLDDVTKSIHTTVMHTVNLLDVSLLDIGKLAISLEWISLKKIESLIQDIVERYSMGAMREGISLLSSIKLDQEKQIEVDILRLRIIIENLLENSFQYCKNKIKVIKLDVSNTSSDINITISDTGIGIPLSEQGKIFTEFFRASNAKKILSNGSGIGLHLSAEYVKAHHGTIRFESKEGVGTTFYISLPLKTSANVNEFLLKV